MSTKDVPAPASEPVPMEGRRRILIIEDHRDAAESLQLLLELQGHEVEAAFDGPSGLDTARRFRPEAWTATPWRAPSAPIPTSGPAP
jgi:PleD family two-component response regulator